MTMSDDGERTCPLCAEEMDITDQQLKPCKCGYEICVWCWHQIIDMAEKEDSEGRCPACRTPYDKDRIVGMAANCERVVAEVNAEKRQKPQKGKPKTSAEARKHLSSVRVVQRNLVYIIGLPSNLSDEALLERKEYFGQYGKVLKVSIARPTSAAQQASNNNTFSVYITYAREEEAIRCIQAVHNFVLDGKQLRACFGTTKYCHSWLRNMTCSNPDCLYLHDIGSQEDSFTKDEIISAYTRSRVPQIAANNLQRRSGTILPPPADELLNGGTYSSRHTTKNASTNSTSQVKAPFPNNSFLGKPTVLPAAASWGARWQAVPSVAGTQGSAKQKSETNNGLALNSPVVASTRSTSAWHDEVVASSKMSEGMSAASSASRSKPSEYLSPCIGSNSVGLAGGSSEAFDVPGVSMTSAWDDDDDDSDVGTIMKGSDEKHAKLYTGWPGSSEHLEARITADFGQSGSNLPPEIDFDEAHDPGNARSSKTQSPSSSEGDRGIIFPGSDTIVVKGAAEVLDRQYSSSIDSSKSIKEYTVDDGNGNDTVLELSSLVIDDYIAVDQSKMDQLATSFPIQESVRLPASASLGLQQHPKENGIELFASVGSVDPSLMSGASMSQDIHDISPGSRGLAACSMKQSDEVALASDDQMHVLGVANQVTSSYLQLTTNVANNGSCSPQNDVVRIENRLVASEKEFLLMNRYVQDKPYALKNEKVLDVSSVQENVNLDVSDNQNGINGAACVDMGESSIISNILALDFDPWTDSFSTANNFSSMLSEADSNRLIGFSNLRKLQNNNESRFSFARKENQESNVETSFGGKGQSERLFSSSPYTCGDGLRNNYLGDKFAGTASYDNSISAVQSDRTTGGSRAKISAPPGFSVPSKAPPGFSSQDRHNQANETAHSEKQLHSSSLANQYQTQTHLTENMGDVEFYDPAILAVGKRRLPFGVNNSGLSLASACSAQTIPSESDPRLHLLMQQPISAEQNLRVADHFGNRLLPSSESHISSGILAHNNTDLSAFAQMSVRQPSNSHIIQNHWDGWNDAQTGNIDIGNVLRNMGYGLHDCHPGNEEHKFHISSSADMYNRSFRM